MWQMLNLTICHILLSLKKVLRQTYEAYPLNKGVVNMSQTAEQLRNVDIRTVDRDSLVDIRDVKINKNQPPQERLVNFVEQIKNPYCYKIGKAIVKVTFADTTATLEDKLENYLLSL